MKDVVKSFGVLSLAVLLTLCLGGAALYAETGEAPSVATADLDLVEAEAVQPDPECESPADAPLLDLQPPTAVPASSGTFFVCLGSDLFCSGGCPSGTRCATEACGSFLRPTCTFQTSCVTACQVSPGCWAIGLNCGF